MIFALLELNKQLAEARGPQTTPSTPSGMIAVYEKPPAKSRKKRPGAKKGHPGSRRCVPDRIDRRELHTLPCCPECGGRLKRTGDTRTRYIEEIPEIQPEVTEHTIHSDWCSQCQKRVEPKVPDALPKSTLGNRVLVLSDWLHYSLGNTLSQIVEVFNFHLQLKIAPVGLIQMWYRLQAIRPAVIIRKNSYGTRSPRGADCQAVLMSVIRTLKQGGHDPITTIYNALGVYLKTGRLPPLPAASV